MTNSNHPLIQVSYEDLKNLLAEHQALLYQVGLLIKTKLPELHPAWLEATSAREVFAQFSMQDAKQGSPSPKEATKLLQSIYEEKREALWQALDANR